MAYPKIIKSALSGTTAIVLILTLFPFSGVAQTKTDTTEAFEAFQKADSLRRYAQYPLSNKYYTEAAELYGKAGLLDKKVEVLYKISLNKTNQGKLKEASEYLENALALYHTQHMDDPDLIVKAKLQKGKIAEADAAYKVALDLYKEGLSDAEETNIPTLTASLIAGIGSVYQDLGEYNRAMREYRRGLKILDSENPKHRTQLANLYNNLGVTHVSKGEFDQAMAFYRKELKISRTIYRDGHPNVAGVYNNLGGLNYRMGDIGEAIDYFKNAAQSFEQAFGVNHPSVAMTYNNIGACYFQLGNLEQSIKYHKESAEIKEQVFEPDHPDVAVSYNNIGSLYIELGDYEKAKDYLHRSLSIRKKALGINHPKLTNTYSSLGNLFLRQNEPDSAIIYFKREVEITQEQRGKNHPYVADALNNIARSYAAQHFFERALAYHQQALHVLSENFRNQNYSANPTVSDLRYPNFAVNVLFDKGKTLQNYFNQDKKVEFLTSGLSTFNRLSDLLDFLQTGFESEESKLLMTRESHEMYEHGIQIANQLFQETGNQEYLEQAFYFAEKSKTRVILELIKTQEAQNFAGIPHSLISYEKKLRDRMTEINQQLNRSIDVPAESSKSFRLRDSLFALNQSLNEHRQVLENRYPRYHNLKFKKDVLNISEIKQVLRNQNLTLVEYFYGEKSAWAFTVDGQRLNMIALPYDSLMNEHVADFRKSITQQSDSMYLYRGSSLYNNLMKPVINRINTSSTLIIPDGVLNLLPFEALLTKPVNQSPKNINFSDLPYLGNKLSISYSPSSSLSSLFRNENPQNYSSEFAAFAPEFNFSKNPIETREVNGVQKWPPLPSTKTEVQQIADLFNQNNGFWSTLFGTSSEPELYFREEATENKFKNTDLGEFKFLHLATHAFASDTGAYRSGIVFHQNPENSEDDILFSEEIYNLELKSKLLVLSACETGMGEIVKGEGIIGLSRAFQYAGVENLLVSLWKVDDRSTARLMINFYENHLDGTSFARALQIAKRDLKNNSAYAHPRYWAPFVLIGR